MSSNGYCLIEARPRTDFCREVALKLQQSGIECLANVANIAAQRDPTMAILRDAQFLHYRVEDRIENRSYSFDAALLKVLFAFVPSVVTVAITVIRIKLNMMAYSVAAAASSSSKNRLIADILLELQ